MALNMSCPECNSSLSLDPALAGKRIRCPRCDAVIGVPASGARPEDGIRGDALQAKSPRDERRRVAEDVEPAGPRRPYAAIHQPLPVGWIVGGVGGAVGLAVVAVVLVLIFVREEPPPPPPPFFQVQAPGFNIKMDVPPEIAKQMQDLQQKMQ